MSEVLSFQPGQESQNYARFTTSQYDCRQVSIAILRSSSGQNTYTMCMCWTRQIGIDPMWKSDFSWMLFMLMSLFSFVSNFVTVFRIQSNESLSLSYMALYMYIFSVKQLTHEGNIHSCIHTYSKHVMPISLQNFLGRTLISLISDMGLIMCESSIKNIPYFTTANLYSC